MNIRRPIVVPVLFAVAAMLVAVSALAYATGEQRGQAVALAPQIVGADTPAPLQPYVSTAPSTTNPAALASMLSYYLISGNTSGEDHDDTEEVRNNNAR